MHNMSVFLPVSSFFFATLCFFLEGVCYFKQSCLAILTTLKIFFREPRVREKRAFQLRSFVAQSSALAVGASRLASNFAIVGQLFLIIIGVLGFLLHFEMAVSAGIPDFLSFPFIGLTLFIFFMSFVLLFKEQYRALPFWCGLLFLLEGLLLIAFTTDNVLLFYVSFEATLMPMYLLIGAWGSRARKIKANYYFFLYTLVGSLITLLGLILIYYFFGSFSYSVITFLVHYDDLSPALLNDYFCHLVWILLSVGFLFKLPLFVFHLWLPEAHVEAPTVGSIILAALLLKLGVYGFARLPLALFPSSTVFWLPLLLPFVITGLIYPAAVAIIQDDMKKVIAYSSISHMALVLFGLLTQTREGVVGALFLSISHGVISGGLFAAIGMIYDRYRSRDLKYFGGLAGAMPLFGSLFVFLVLGNMGFPFLCNFPGELLILTSGLERFGFLLPFLGLSFFLTAIYSLRLINLVLFGMGKLISVRNRYDTLREEYLVLGTFCWGAVILGIFCSPLLLSFEIFFLHDIAPFGCY